MQNDKQADKIISSLVLPLKVKLAAIYVLFLGVAMLGSYIPRRPFGPTPVLATPAAWLFLVGIVISSVIMGIPLIFLQTLALLRKARAASAVSFIFYILIAEQLFNIFYQGHRGMQRTVAGYVVLFFVMGINVMVSVIMRHWAWDIDNHIYKEKTKLR